MNPFRIIITKKIFLLIQIFLLLISICGVPRVSGTEIFQDLFPDTLVNRKLVAQAYLQHQEIDKNHGHFINVNGIKMHYLEWGDEKGTPLIWSHGYSSTGFELLSVAPQLVDAGYHVYAITYRGHGQTLVDDYNFSLSHIVDDISVMMDKLNIEKAVIGGLSLGGGVATTFYEYHPERVLGIALEDGGGDVVQHRLEKNFTTTQKAMANMPELQTTFEDRFAGFKYMASWYLSGWAGVMPEGAAPIFHSWLKPNEAGGVKLHFDDAKLWGDPRIAIDPAQGHKLSLLSQSWRRVNPIISYRNLTVPMLIINPTGDGHDATADFEKLRVMHNEWVKVIEYPDTPHVAHPMRPQWFVRDMKELLNRIKTTKIDLGVH